MKKTLLLLTGLAAFSFGQAQVDIHPETDTSWKKIYRETPEIVNDLVHTKLDASFDFTNAYLNGKAWITIKPHFYPTDSVNLDAKGMEIKKVSLVKGGTSRDLKYDYDGMNLRINLDKTYKKQESYTIYIDYVAKPNEFKVKGSAAITDAKGLYFINPKGEEKDKPTQVWTQGETEATSVWCPTIDKPNQKTTQEISMTVPSKFVTLSNGKLVSQKKNSNGTRTDTWKMELPHAPYLFFMGIGEYAVIKDSYKGKEVSYYVEKEYAPVARKIFGNTPEMMAYFSKILGVEYPWVKYAQIVGRDYVSGAMENTTATLHQESAQQDARELVDENSWERVIAHELFHHWFGDLVTSESWSNLTVNESFANYSEYLWNEYKYGKDDADAHNFEDQQGYLFSQSEKKDLVRFRYTDKEDMFDAVSYNKGGRILHMLRNYVGDSAFFASLNKYLTTNKFKAAESHHLRLAFEEVTGKDLNWFWNQWYFGAGHPKLTIDYLYDDAAKKVNVVVKQTQAGGKVFRLPVAIDIYNGSKKTRHNVWVENAVDTFSFAYNTKPDLVNFDGDKILLAEKKENKTLDNYIFQYKQAGKYLDRREAIDFIARNQQDPKAAAALIDAMKDPYDGLQIYAMSKLDMKKEAVANQAEPLLADLAKSKKALVRNAALGALDKTGKDSYKELYLKYTKDSSYTVAGTALEALSKTDSVKALSLAKELSSQPAKGKLVEAITKVMIKSGDESGFPMIAKAFKDMPLSQAKFNLVLPLTQMLGKMNDTQKVKEGIDLIVDFRNGIPEQYGITPVVNNFLKQVIKQKESGLSNSANKSALQEQIDYINSKISEEKKAF
jgi:aminopeptidase N